MANKTPFEIRTDLLSQAQSIIFEKMMAERMRLENDWACKRELWLSKATEGKTFDPQPLFPQLPIITTEEIIEEAKKLNDFVSNG